MIVCGVRNAVCGGDCPAVIVCGVRNAVCGGD
jgi:hypothetical protein